jgi:ribosomal protein S18 acetylase RimI-like enzyme
MSNLEIRPIDSGNTDEIINLYGIFNKVFKHTYEDPASYATYAGQTVEKDGQEVKVFGLYDGDNIVGGTIAFALANMDEDREEIKGESAYIDNLAILEEYRGKGQGKALLEALKNGMNKGCSFLAVQANTDKNIFYKNCGYTDTRIKWHAASYEEGNKEGTEMEVYDYLLVGTGEVEKAGVLEKSVFEKGYFAQNEFGYPDEDECTGTENLNAKEHFDLVTARAEIAEEKNLAQLENLPDQIPLANYTSENAGKTEA